MAPELNTNYVEVAAGVILDWKDQDEYQKLHENVQHAVDLAKTKSSKTEFWHQLQNLNDKILIYKDMFYS